MAKVLLREALVLGWGQDGGLCRVERRDAEYQGLLPFPVPSHTPTLYTSLFISVQNHVSILHKEHPTFYPTLSPHNSTLALGSIPPEGGG